MGCAPSLLALSWHFGSTRWALREPLPLCVSYCPRGLGWDGYSKTTAAFLKPLPDPQGGSCILFGVLRDQGAEREGIWAEVGSPRPVRCGHNLVLRQVPSPALPARIHKPGPSLTPGGHLWEVQSQPAGAPGFSVTPQPPLWGLSGVSQGWTPRRRGSPA